MNREEGWARSEMQGAALWDARCLRSVATICERRFERPRVSFSKACGDAVRQAGHRICSHAKTTVDGLLRGHFQQTAERCRVLYAQDPDHPILLVADTTSLNYASHPATEGLGPINQTLTAHGLLAHCVLALPWFGVPAGLAHLAIWARDPEKLGKSRQRLERAKTPTALKEGQKWIDGLWGAEATLPPEVPALLIADREADCFDLFAAPRRPGLNLLVRAHQPRRAAIPGETSADRERTGKLEELVSALPSWGTLKVEVPRQRGKPARTAVLEVRSTPVTLPPPAGRPAHEPSLALWVVQAREVEAPPGAEPLNWLLLTTCPIQNFREAQQLLRYYTRLGD